jgi:hypothetical protein
MQVEEKIVSEELNPKNARLAYAMGMSLSHKETPPGIRILLLTSFAELLPVTTLPYLEDFARLETDQRVREAASRLLSEVTVGQRLKVQGLTTQSSPRA